MPSDNILLAGLSQPGRHGYQLVAKVMLTGKLRGTAGRRTRCCQTGVGCQGFACASADGPEQYTLSAVMSTRD